MRRVGAGGFASAATVALGLTTAAPRAALGLAAAVATEGAAE